MADETTKDSIEEVKEQAPKESPEVSKEAVAVAEKNMPEVVQESVAEQKDMPSEEVKEEPAKEEEKALEKQDLRPGYVVRVHTKITQGEKERVQIFEGVIIAMKGKGVGRTMTVRKIGEGGVGVERIWPIASPSILKVEVVSKAKVRRSKLYFLRQSLQKMKEMREKSV